MMSHFNVSLQAGEGAVAKFQSYYDLGCRLDVRYPVNNRLTLLGTRRAACCTQLPEYVN